MKRLRTALLAPILGSLAAFAAPAWASDSATSDRPTIHVTGSGELTIDPDHAQFLVSVDSTQATSAAAAADDARITRAVLDALMGAGAPRDALSTVRYSVQPQWEYRPSIPPRRTGYLASASIRVEVRKLDTLGTWIDAALSAGATRIEGLKFEPKDAAGARAQALTLAVAQARSDAETLARAAGGTLGPLEELSTGQNVRAVGFEEVVVTAQRRTADETQITPSPLSIRAAVEARWAFEAGH